MHGAKLKLVLSALLLPVGLASSGCGDSGSSGESSTPAVDTKAAVGPPGECSARVIEIVDADYMRERGVVAEPGQEALFRLARKRVIADVCSSIPAATTIGEAAEEAAAILVSEAE